MRQQYFEIRSGVVNELHAKGKAYPHKVRLTAADGNARA